MRHGVRKIRFKHGSDASEMLTKKLVVNFVSRSKIETTLTRAKVLKPLVDRLVEKAKKETEANKRYLTVLLGDRNLVNKTFKNIGQVLKDKKGGYVRIIRLGIRNSDGAESARLEWVYPIVMEEKKEVKKEQQNKLADSTSKKK